MGLGWAQQKLREIRAPKRPDPMAPMRKGRGLAVYELRGAYLHVDTILQMHAVHRDIRHGLQGCIM